MMKTCLFLYCLLFGWFGLMAQDSGIKKDYVIVRYQDGSIASEGLMVNGLPDGCWKTFYVTGILKSEGNRKGHLLDSTWVFYDETGDTAEIIHYLSGKKNGYYSKYAKSVIVNNTSRNIIISKELYINDKREGDSFFYFADGKLHEVIHFKNNRRNGPGKEYDNFGNIITIYEFFNDFMTEKQTLNRSDKGLKQGLWRTFFENGRVKSERVFQNDNLHGISKEFDIHGNLLLSLFFQKGKLVEKELADSVVVDERFVYYETGTLRSKGNYLKNLPIGIHRFYSPEGKIENAFIYDEFGRIASEGIIGEDGSKEGLWKNYFEDGKIRSSGMYANNRQNGDWSFFFSNGGSEEIGSFSNGYFSGQWKWFYQSGSVLRIENFKDGRSEGKFLEFSESGDTIVNGFYESGEKNGFWITKVGDIIEKGNYLHNFKNGIWTAFYLNGKLFYKGNYSFGNPDGKFVYYYENGRLMEEQEYFNGIKEKTWKKYFPDGLILIAVTYEHDTETRINGIKVERRK